ncbi:hypothetical protein OC846_005941 [Tilletia horrida]|uniref:F-box domain-containing protein n=1 Tax=Tilletia horrida TaxID=155126 RepID=A0AAN6GJK1_9BASI|nr:hypothetical protein OC846_005941 [Tilletia horrida]KAK0560919.1 hypothetical protein OC861_006063 [Tilletia horrida]
MEHDCTSSPSWRVWRTHELALTILSELNQLDLLSLSLVSRHFRFLSLSRLLHKQLDLPLTKVASYVPLVANNQAQAQLLRHIRIYDDVLPARLRHRPRTSRESAFLRSGLVYRPAGINRGETIAKDVDYDSSIVALDKFLHVFATQCSSRPPSFDLTIGLSNATEFARLIRAHPVLADGLVGLRIIVDHTDEPDEDTELVKQTDYVNAAEAQWTSLAQLVEHVQTRPSALKIRTAHFVDPRPGSTGHWHAPRSIWDSLGKALSGSVRSLAIRLGADEGVEQRRCALLSIDWPNLRSFSLTMRHPFPRNTGHLYIDAIQTRLNDFLARHAAQLEDLRINSVHFFYERTLPITFSRLRNCEVDIMKPDQLCAFIAAHKNSLVHVRFPQPLGTASHSDGPRPEPISVPPDLESAMAPAHLLSYCGPIGPALSFAKRGSSIRQLRLENDQVIVDVGQDFVLDALRNSMSNQAESVTCLDITFNCFPSDWLNGKLRRSLSTPYFPSLVELRLGFNYSRSVGSSTPESSTWAEAQEHVLAILKALGGSGQIVALRLGLHSLPPPPMAEIKVADQNGIPPSLQYLIFHSSTPPEDHYFAVQRNSQQPDLGANQNKKIGARLCRFRPIFRDIERRHDLWSTPPLLEPGPGTLFDHSKTPPVLLIL